MKTRSPKQDSDALAAPSIFPGKGQPKTNTVHTCDIGSEPLTELRDHAVDQPHQRTDSMITKFTRQADVMASAPRCLLSMESTLLARSLPLSARYFSVHAAFARQLLSRGSGIMSDLGEAPARDQDASTAFAREVGRLESLKRQYLG